MRAFNWTEWDYNDIAWAVIERHNGEMSRIHGTAVPLIDDLFITAHHVWNSLEASSGVGEPALLRTFSDGLDEPPDLAGACRFELDHVYPELDVCLLRARGVDLAPSNVRVLQTEGFMARPGLKVRALGFPHVAPRNYFFRLLEGSVVALRLAGEDGSTLQIDDRAELLETSFDCPKGLSGAALCQANVRKRNPIVGLIIGSLITESMPHRVDHEDGVTHTSQHYAAFGAAISFDQILRQPYGRTTLREMLVDRGMVVMGS